jgi:hypothetical protein
LCRQPTTFHSIDDERVRESVVSKRVNVEWEPTKGWEIASFRAALSAGATQGRVRQPNEPLHKSPDPFLMAFYLGPVLLPVLKHHPPASLVIIVLPHCE